MRNFKVLENRDYGHLSHLVFQDIAHHFATDDADARRWGDATPDAGAELTASGLIKSDFACFVCS
ncbi:MAG TPA: hypothetical protein VGO85_11010 [Caldimonas sp.]|nr:hypothetical protein [Caldimonas sp.]